MSYAIFTTGGRQFRAEPGVTTKVPLLDAKPGDEVSFDHVPIASAGKQGETGKPLIKGTNGPADVVRHGTGNKGWSFPLSRPNGSARHAVPPDHIRQRT